MVETFLSTLVFVFYNKSLQIFFASNYNSEFLSKLLLFPQTSKFLPKIQESTTEDCKALYIIYVAIIVHLKFALTYRFRGQNVVCIVFHGECVCVHYCYTIFIVFVCVFSLLHCHCFVCHLFHCVRFVSMRFDKQFVLFKYFSKLIFII